VSSPESSVPELATTYSVICARVSQTLPTYLGTTFVQ